MNIAQQVMQSAASHVKQCFGGDVLYNHTPITALSFEQREAREQGEYGIEVIYDAIIAVDKSDVATIVVNVDKVTISGVEYLVIMSSDEVSFWVLDLRAIERLDRQSVREKR